MAVKLSLTLKEHRVRIFENDVKRKISGLRRQEVTGDWRQFDSNELHNSIHLTKYYSVITFRRMGSAAHVARTVEKRNAYMFWWGNQKE
jgi:hypothetical protein